MNHVIDRFSLYLQTFLWLFGYSWHNSVRDECTPDFSCCVSKCKENFKERWKSLFGLWRESRMYKKSLDSET